MRQYEPIWCRIKSKNHASIATHPTNVAKVIKAVIKEKNKDVGYKLLLSESALKATLDIRKEESKEVDDIMIVVHFSLTKEIKESFIGAANL